MTTEQERPATLTAAELARLFGVSPATIYKLAKSGDLPTLKFGRKVLFARHAVELLLARGTLGSKYQSR